MTTRAEVEQFLQQFKVKVDVFGVLLFHFMCRNIH